MPLLVYNTLTRRKEELQTLVSGKVGMYVCGVTVYDECHLGHARAYVAFDCIRRYLEHRGYEVRSIQNFTDVDDKIIDRARQLRKEREATGEKPPPVRELCREIAERFSDDYFRTMDRLGIQRAGMYPKATEHIGEMIALIQRLIDRGYGYVVDGDVYFSVSSFEGYGKLSGRNIDEMVAGARVAVDERKREPLDFALWKQAKEEEPTWPSPWGPGRPGWHIECSAMSMKYLGETFDIHSGGQDLIFPHHENEIAQAEAATGKPFARCWLHNGFVTIDKEKMSKSLGNFFTLREIFERHEPAVVRFFLIGTHYRSPIDFSDERLAEAGRSLARIHECDTRIEMLPARPPGDTGGASAPGELTRRFEEAMDNDFNTAGALGAVFDESRRLNSLIDEGKTSDPGFWQAVREWRSLREVLGVGLPRELPRRVVLEAGEKRQDIDEKRIGDLLGRAAGLGDGEISELLQERERARAQRKFQLADRIRDGLAGVVNIQDIPGAALWRRATK